MLGKKEIRLRNQKLYRRADMLDTIPNEEEMTALVGKSLYDI